MSFKIEGNHSDNLLLSCIINSHLAFWSFGIHDLGDLTILDHGWLFYHL